MSCRRDPLPRVRAQNLGSSPLPQELSCEYCHRPNNIYRVGGYVDVCHLCGAEQFNSAPFDCDRQRDSFEYFSTSAFSAQEKSGAHFKGISSSAPVPGRSFGPFITSYSVVSCADCFDVILEMMDHNEAQTSTMLAVCDAVMENSAGGGLEDVPGSV